MEAKCGCRRAAGVLVSPPWSGVQACSPASGLGDPALGACPVAGAWCPSCCVDHPFVAVRHTSVYSGQGNTS